MQIDNVGHITFRTLVGTFYSRQKLKKCFGVICQTEVTLIYQGYRMCTETTCIKAYSKWFLISSGNILFDLNKLLFWQCRYVDNDEVPDPAPKLSVAAVPVNIFDKGPIKKKESTKIWNLFLHSSKPPFLRTLNYYAFVQNM